jgi:hypothetical protein
VKKKSAPPAASADHIALDTTKADAGPSKPSPAPTPGPRIKARRSLRDIEAASKGAGPGFPLGPHHHQAVDHDGNPLHVHLGGYKRQEKDERDAKYALRIHPLLTSSDFGAAPPEVDNTPDCTPISDQGHLGSCTSHAVSALIEHNEIIAQQRASWALEDQPRKPTILERLNSTLQRIAGASSIDNGPNGPSLMIPISPPPVEDRGDTGPSVIRVSRDFQYYNTTKILGYPGKDRGGTLRSAVQVGSLYGFLDERVLPYTDDPRTFAKAPPKADYTLARQHRITSYHAIADGDVETMKSVLAMGKLICFGFDVYDNMMTQAMALKGHLSRPKKTDKILGGHAVALVGYSDSKKAFLVRNSWGVNWGNNGYFLMDYDYVGDPKLSSDFWVIESNAFA